MGVGFKEEEKDDYSDSDESGPKRVDVSDVKGLDWMAPDTLRKVVEVKRTKEKPKPATDPTGASYSSITIPYCECSRCSIS